MRREAYVVAWGALAVLWACDSGSAPEETKCGEANKVGMTSWGTSTTLLPGATLEVATAGSVCNGQCPVTGQKWTATPVGTGKGTLGVEYGAHCGPNMGGAYSNDEIGTCKLAFNGATPLTDASLADSHDADCVGLWAGVNPTDPAMTQPCGKGSPLNFRPYIIFTNNTTVSVIITGPGPGSNPTAECVYASGT